MKILNLKFIDFALKKKKKAGGRGSFQVELSGSLRLFTSRLARGPVL